MLGNRLQGRLVKLPTKQQDVSLGSLLNLYDCQPIFHPIFIMQNIMPFFSNLKPSFFSLILPLSEVFNWVKKVHIIL